MKTPTSQRARPAGLLMAMALGLAIALGGLLWLDSGSAQASSNVDTLSAVSGPMPDSDACSTTGFYVGGSYSPIYIDGTFTPVVTGVPYYGYPYGAYPYGGYPYGYPYGGAPYMGGYPFYTYVYQAPIVISPPEQPIYGEAYTSPQHVNYPCNAFSNCDPIANANAAICPGVATGITLNSSLTSATCGSATNIDAKVVGANNLIVGDGTPVLFSTTLGMIPSESSTDGGIASASLVFPPKTSGVADITVTAGTAKATAKITVTC